MRFLCKYWLLLVIPLLTCCSLYQGVAGEYYGGKKIEVDQDSLANYETNRRVPAKDFSDEAIAYFLTPSLPTPTDSIEKGLTKFPYKVGKDLPAGRYLVQYEEYDRPDTFIVRNDAGEVVYQQRVSAETGTYELTLYEGQSIEGTTDTIASNVLRNVPSLDSNGGRGKTFASGIWHVGTEIEPGSYTITLNDNRSYIIPYLTMVTKDGEVSSYELFQDRRVDDGTENTELEPTALPIELEEGSTLILEDAFPIVLTPQP